MKKSLLSLLVLLALNQAIAQVQYPLVTIDSIQRRSAADLGANLDKSPLLGDTVRVRGVVMVPPGQAVATTVSTRWIWISSGSGSWSGLNIRDTDWTPTSIEGSFNLPQAIVGDSIEVVGVVEEFPTQASGTETQLNPLNNYLDSLGGNVRLLGPGSTYPGATGVAVPRVLVQELNDANNNWKPTTGEQHEGRFAEVRNLIVTQITASTGDRNRFICIDSLNNTIEIFDRHWVMRSNAATGNPNGTDKPAGIATVFPNFISPSVGTCYNSIRGIIEQITNNGVPSYVIAPFDTSHFRTRPCVVPSITAVTRNSTIPLPNTPITVTATVVDPSGTTPIDTVKLFYAFGTTTNAYTQLIMARVGTTNDYTAIIPGQPDTTFIKYFVRATNTSNIPTVFPAGAPSSGLLFVRVRASGNPTINDLQFTPLANGNSGYIGLQVSVTGVVTMRADSISITVTRLFLQQEGATEWGGLRVYGNNISQPAIAGNFNVGDRITVTGSVIENFNVTSITNVTAAVAASPATGTITPLNLNPANFTTVGTNNERFENMLVVFRGATASDSLYIVQTNADGTSNFGEYRVGRVLSTPTSGSRVLVGRAEGSRTVSYTNNATGITVRPPLVRDTVQFGDRMTSITGIMFFSFSNWKLIPRTNADYVNYTKAGFFVGIEDEASVLIDAQIYPNPADAALQIELNGSTSVHQLYITDMVGKRAKTATLNEGINTVRVDDLPNGQYILNLVNERTGRAKRTTFIINR